ncbi:MAG: hypothetical protein ACMG6E_09550, partial [Candidatus Roizmanbacteria bacterium]
MGQEQSSYIIDTETDVYKNINQHETLGQGGFGTVFSDRHDKTMAYKLIFSRKNCKNARLEAEIQNECAEKVNNLLEQLPIPIRIPIVTGYNEFSCTFCEMQYDCIIAMQRVPFFNKNIQVAYQLGMGVEKDKEHGDDDGVKIYTAQGQPRGMFIREQDLLRMSEIYNFSWQDVCLSWGFAICALIFIAKNDVNDLEYVLSRSNGSVTLNIIDFGLTKKIDEDITPEILIENLATNLDL